MQPEKNKIVLIGAGNVATQLGIALYEKGFPVVQVYSRTLSSAKALGERLQTVYTDDLQTIVSDAAIYLFALKDSAFSGVLSHFPIVSGLFVHTAGSLSLQVFGKQVQRCGVLYPLQTFSKGRNVLFDHLPFFVEANNPADEQLLEQLARMLSDRVIHLSSEKRKQLHLAAVFACNFSNHMYTLAAELLEEQQLPWDLLLPLVQETAAKIIDLHPKKAQTGPAVRYDQGIMNLHEEMLSKDKDKQELYRAISRSIHSKSVISDQNPPEFPPRASSPI